jgi:cobalt-zinc-cadmium efflux system outer membrane protein
VKVLGEFVSIAEKTRKSVDARVKAGKASPIELDRALVAAARAKALQGAEKARLDAAKRKLSTLWGAHAPDFGAAAGRLGNGISVPSVEALKTFLNSNPTLARWSDEVSRRAAQVDLEHAKAIPDLRVGAGVRQFNENDSTAIVASLAIPLPIFDRNDGNIAAAESRLVKAESDALAVRDELLRALIEAVGELEVAATQLNGLKRDVLPVAQTAFDRTKIGYDEGKFDLLNVLDVQRSVFEVRLDLLNARADYEKARVKVEALIGRDIKEF